MHLPLTAEAASPRQRASAHPARRARAISCGIVIATAAAATATPAAAPAAPSAAPSAAPAHHCSRAIQREHCLRLDLCAPLCHRHQRRTRRLHVHEDTAAALLLLLASAPVPTSAAPPLHRLAPFHRHAIAQCQPCPRRHLDRRPASLRLLRRQPRARLAPRHVALLVHLEPLARGVGPLLPALLPAVLAHIFAL